MCDSYVLDGFVVVVSVKSSKFLMKHGRHIYYFSSVGLFSSILEKSHSQKRLLIFRYHLSSYNYLYDILNHLVG